MAEQPSRGTSVPLKTYLQLKIHFHPPATGKDIFCYPRLLQALSNLILHFQAATASLGKT